MTLHKTPLDELGLSEKTRSAITSIYAKYPAIQKVICYGSRAMGTFREGSDIDMTIVADSAFSHADLLRVLNDFDDSDLPYLVDISIFSELKNPDLVDHILRRGKLIYERT